MRWLLLLWALGVPLLVSAQTNAPGGTAQSSSVKERLIGFLPPADQDRVTAAYDKALTDQPDLSTQEQSLREQRDSLPKATPEQKRAFRENVRKYQQKLRQTMLSEDPSLGPILDQVDKHLSQMRAQQERAMEQGGAGSP